MNNEYLWGSTEYRVYEHAISFLLLTLTATGNGKSGIDRSELAALDKKIRQQERGDQGVLDNDKGEKEQHLREH